MSLPIVAKRSSDTGFTLIELLIVFTIVGLLVSLVAPVGNKQFRQAQSQAERVSLQRTLDVAAFEAYSRGTPIELIAEGLEIHLRFGNGGKKVIRFEHLSFSPKQVIYINSNGVAAAATLSVMQSGEKTEIRLNRWLDDAA